MENNSFWKIINKYSYLYLNVFIASIIVNLFSLTMPLFIMNVYDRIIPNSAFESLWVLAIGMFIVAILDFILRMTRIYFVDMAGRNADIKLQRIFLKNLFDVRLDFLYKNKETSTVGALISRVRELEYVREFLSSSTLLALADLPFIILFITLIFFLGGNLGFIPLIAIPLIFVFTYFAKFSFIKYSKNQMYANSLKQSFLTEIISSLETVKISNLTNELLKQWEEILIKSADSNVEAKKQNALTAHFFMFINLILTISLVILGVYQITEGNLTTGGLIACVIIFGRISAPLNGLINILTSYHRAKIILNQYDKLMHLPKENPNSENDFISNTIPININFENVSFSYPSQESSIMALNNINMKITPGAKVAFLGSTGSGKSSLARLLAGLYLPTGGQIRLGQLDLAKSPMQAYRNNIGYLPQEIHIFKGSLYQNIAMAWAKDTTCPEELVYKAAEISGVMDFAGDHPLGLNLPLGEQGTGISGGQAQAVALARAILNEPQILILDEPSAQLDIKSEQKLIERLNSIIENKTFLLFTHKPAMLEMVNRVVVLEKGQFIWEGSRKQALEKIKII